MRAALIERKVHGAHRRERKKERQVWTVITHEESGVSDELPDGEQ